MQNGYNDHMDVTIQRTPTGTMRGNTGLPMVDMYVVYFAPPRTRFICFTSRQFEELFPEAKLERGERKIFKMHLTKEEKGV